MRARRSALALGVLLALGACVRQAVSEELSASEPAPVAEAKPTPSEAVSEAKPTPPSEAKAAPPSEAKAAPKLDDVSAVAEPTASKDSAQRLGLKLSDAPFEIDARSAEMLEDAEGGESLRFRGAVTLKQGELKLTCDRLDAYFPRGRGQGRPQKFVASGDVTVLQGDFELRCTRATFEEGSCIAVCLSSETCQSGKWPEKPARFRRGKDWIEGRELEFNQCTGKMFARCGARLSVAPKPKDETEQKAESADESAKPEPAAPPAGGPAKPAVAKP